MTPDDDVLRNEQILSTIGELARELNAGDLPVIERHHDPLAGPNGRIEVRVVARPPWKWDAAMDIWPGVTPARAEKYALLALLRAVLLAAVTEMEVRRGDGTVARGHVVAGEMFDRRIAEARARRGDPLQQPPDPGASIAAVACCGVEMARVPSADTAATTWRCAHCDSLAVVSGTVVTAIVPKPVPGTVVRIVAPTGMASR